MSRLMTATRRETLRRENAVTIHFDAKHQRDALARQGARSGVIKAGQNILYVAAVVRSRIAPRRGGVGGGLQLTVYVWIQLLINY